MVSLGLCVAWTARATVAGNVLIPNYSGILVQAGGVLPAIPVQADYVVNNFSSTKLLSGTYRVGFQLLDAGGNPMSPEAFSASFGVILPPLAADQGTVTATLAPAGLVTGTPYHVGTHVYVNQSGTWVPAGFPGSSDNYQFTIIPVGTDSGVVAWMNAATVTRAYAVATAPGSDSFQVLAEGVLGRLDQPTQPVTTDAYQLFLNLTLTGARTGSIPLTNPRITVPVAVANHAADSGPAAVLINQTLDLRPAVQLDSTDSYTIQVAMSHAGPDGVEVPDQTQELAGQRLLHFNGTLLVGTMAATLSSLGTDPVPEGTVNGVGENTEIVIGDNGAILNAIPAYTLQPGQNLHVLLGIDGTATASDPASVVPASATPVNVAGVQFTLDGMTVDATGGHATGGTVRFPAGFGIASDPTVRRLNGDFPLGPLNLDAALNPTGVIELTPFALNAAALYAVHEDLPEQFTASSISWDTAAGTFAVHRTDMRHVRADETQALAALPLVPENLVAKMRPSNDGYLASPGTGAGRDVVVRADAQGRAVLDDATIDLPQGQFTAHFPAGVTIAWTGQGQLVIKGGAVDVTQSTLPGAADTLFSTLPGAPNLNLIGGSETLDFTTVDWHFTPDGGLHAEGTIPSNTLRWGARNATDFAQSAGQFTTAAAYMPGAALRGTVAVTPLDMRPGELLLSGQGQPGDPTYVERPLTSGYAAGLADYPGLNLRATGAGAQTATSLLDDAVLGPYGLSAASKYYLRQAGVSGIHVADPAFFGGGGVALTMDGFHLTLTDYQLAFLDNSPRDSRVAGTVDVPGALGKPGFSVAFSKLGFDSQGHPHDVALVEAGDKPLTYWHAQFHPLTAEFVATPTVPMATALVFGAEVLLPGIIQEPVRGGLGFFPNGNLVTAANGIPGVNSRLKPPKTLSLHGTGSLNNPAIPAFSVQPVTDFYFNDPAVASPPADGFVAFAGTIHVPFFQDLKVHVLARADTGRTAVRAGWSDGKSDFFNNHYFDSNNVGFPTGVTYPVYVNEDEPPNFTYYDESDVTHTNRNPYNPIARQSWLGFVDFAMPVKWDPAQRIFLSSVPEDRRFLVLNSQRTIQKLTPSGAEIRIGLQFNKLPRLSLTSLFIDDREATQELIQLIPQGKQLADALDSFGKLLNGNSDQLVEDGVDTAVDSFLDYLFSANGPLHGVADAAGAAAVLNGAASPAFNQARIELVNRLSGVVGAITDANSIAGKISDALNTIDGGLSTADQLLQKDSQGNRGTFIADAVNAAKTLGLQSADVDSVSGSITAELNGELAPTLDDIQGTLDQVHSLSQSARGFVDDARQVMQGALQVANGAGALPDQMLAGMHDYFAKAHDPTGQMLAELGPAQLRAALKSAIHDTIRESDFLAQIQQTVRDLAESLHEQYGSAYEQLFGVFNDVVRSGLEELNNQVVDHLNDTVGKINRAYGAFSQSLELSKAEGNLHILGDVVDSAHINATLGLHVPDRVTLIGTLDFKHSQADQAVPPCAFGVPDGRMQITVSASGDASLGGGAPAHAEVHGQYTMNAQGEPLAVTGGLSLSADVHVDIVSLKKADFEFAFGQYDNYIRAEGAGSILVFDVTTRAFFGKTCDANLVKWIDPQLDELFANLNNWPAVSTNHPLIGYYTMADGDVILNRIVDIPDSVVTVKVGGGTGNFMFVTPDLASLILGMHWRYAAGVGAAGVSGGAEFKALGALGPIHLLTDNGLPAIADTFSDFFKDPLNLLPGVIHGKLTLEAKAWGVTFPADLSFTATGHYVPPPLVPPPGGFLVNKVKLN
jgi:hypothetical protein